MIQTAFLYLAIVNRSEGDLKIWECAPPKLRAKHTKPYCKNRISKFKCLTEIDFDDQIELIPHTEECSFLT